MTESGREQQESSMNITEAYQYIEERNQLGSVLGLEHIKELLQRLGEPQNQCKVVHIAGTNGKGSILAYMEQALLQEGYKVGKYSSPTVFCYLERFQINGEPMPESVYPQYLERVMQCVQDMEADGKQKVTAFEIETAVAFLYFLEEQTDIVLLETGMGGRLDATNVVAHPVCTILASISLDHMAILGDTVEAITREKTGILRDRVPCVVYPENEKAMPVIEEQCRIHNCEMIVPDLAALKVVSEDLNHEKFAYKNVNYELQMLGKYQIYNAITALEALEITRKVLNDSSENGLKNVNIQKGLANTHWRARFEILSRQPYVIRDGAHNMDAARKLYEQMTKHFTNRRILYIIGILGDKQYRDMLALLVPMAWKVYVLTVPENKRALPAETLAQEVQKYCSQVEIAATPEEAYQRAKQEAEPEDVILAFGSLYYIGRIGE